MPRFLLTDQDLPDAVRGRRAAQAALLLELKKDPSKLTLQQRLDRIEKILGINQPVKGGG